MTGTWSGCRERGGSFTSFLRRNNMTTNNAIGGKVIVHAGTRYAGMAQKDCDYYRNDNCGTLIDRAKKFFGSGNVLPRANKKGAFYFVPHDGRVQALAITELV